MNAEKTKSGRHSFGALATPLGLTGDSALEFLKKNGVHFVLAQFVDIHGVAKSKAVPRHHLGDLLTDGAGFAGAGAWGLGIKPHESEYMVRCELDTLRLKPWRPEYASMFGVGLVDGEEHPIDTRNVLRRQLDRLAKRGLKLNTGMEPEFILLREQNGEFVPFDETDKLAKAAYDYRGLSRAREFLHPLVETLEAVGIDVYQIDHEDANGQYEINFRYNEALRTADQITYFKMAAAEIAHDIGAICTFMPKPKAESTGNGMHIHLSLEDESGKNAFGDDSDPRGMGLSKLAYHFLGGLLAHAPALTALLAPTVNSYKRLVVGNNLSGTTWAPVYVAYGDNNRTAMVRVPYGRLELRVGDSAMNPYLATAAMLAAGLDGVDRELDPGEPHNINFYDLSLKQIAEMAVDVLPQNLNEALAALRSDSLFADTLGEELISEFLEIKQEEWTEYHRSVSQWEINRYLRFY
ncbi:type III glutamate--ammonia ligase [Roseovarius nitratireducens]|uniref:type III glutamate--ammonia ligase n=1 Tax=Roseovarius nitratireducens TaxID=2044597 RepID=UPI000CE182A0|nr:type III glutamate--ammonia ligase [Roseovarius nitratireducens]